MQDDSGGSILNPTKLFLIVILAVILVMGATVALNAGTSTEQVKKDVVVENNTTNITQNVSKVSNSIIAQDNLGNVTKIGTYGNTNSTIRIAMVIGVDQRENTSNSVIPTLESMSDLRYAYDVYQINTTSENVDNSTENLTVVNKSRSLAYEYVFPDVARNAYNLTVDVQGVSDSNSFVFVPTENTRTSKGVVDFVSQNSQVVRYTPNTYNYASYISIPLINANNAAIEYVSNQFYSSSPSEEVASVIHAIDNFDFEGFAAAANNNTTSNNTVTANDFSSGNTEVSDASSNTNSTQASGNSSQ